MIKVLMIGNSENVKGGITSVINQMKKYEWKENQIKFRFIATFNGGNNIYKIFFFIMAFFKIMYCFIFAKPDIIHIHMSHKGSFRRKYLISKLAKRFKIKIVIHLHGSEFKTWYSLSKEQVKKKVKWLLKNADKFIVLGKKWDSVIKEIEHDCKTVIVSNSVNIPKEVAKYNNNKCNILFLGVLVKRKGVFDLLDAVSKIDYKLKDKYFLTIAGTGNEEKSLKDMVKKLKLNDHVEFYGWANEKDKKELLKNSQLFILPSYNEGLPVAILEAMSYGIPIISTDVGDVKEVVNDDTGILYQPGDIKKLIISIEKMLLLNKNEWEKYSLNCKKLIEKKFNIKNNEKIIINLYKGFFNN